MNRTFNRYFGLMLLLVVAAELALAQQPPIKIGALNALSGSFAAYGKSGRQGAQLAIDEINASGGLLGRKLELIQVDDQAKPDVGVQEARRLILDEKVNFLIGIDSSSVALGVAPLTNEYKIPLVVTHGATPALTEQCNPYVFRTSNNARMDANAAADLAAKLPYKRWANIGPDYEFGHSSWNDFIARLKEKRPDVEVVGEQWPKGGESNYTPYITALVQQRPEAVFAALWAGDLVTFVRQANAFGFFKQIKLFEDPVGAALESIGPIGQGSSPRRTLLHPLLVPAVAVHDQQEIRGRLSQQMGRMAQLQRRRTLRRGADAGGCGQESQVARCGRHQESLRSRWRPDLRSPRRQEMDAPGGPPGVRSAGVGLHHAFERLSVRRSQGHYDGPGE